MKLFLLGGIDADGDFFVVGVFDSLEKAKDAIDKEQNCEAEWGKEEEPVFFYSNSIPLESLHCEFASYYACQLTLNEAL